jgi:hypothetical protein
VFYIILHLHGLEREGGRRKERDETVNLVYRCDATQRNAARREYLYTTTLGNVNTNTAAQVYEFFFIPLVASNA